jgi:hypothetical protein
VFFAVGFWQAQQELAFVQPELGSFPDGKQRWMLFAFGPDTVNQAVGLKNVFLAKQFMRFLCSPSVPRISPVTVLPPFSSEPQDAESICRSKPFW